MVSRILAFRPATVVERLAPRSDACPLSIRDLLGAPSDGLVLPFVRAPIAGIARGTLVAAKELQSAIGLALPRGTPPEAWFEAVTRAADDLAAGLPIVLSGEVAVGGEGATQVERAFHQAWRLVDAGVTHLAIDVAAVAPAERSRVLDEVAQAGADRGIGIDVIVPLAEGAQTAPRAAGLFEDLARRDAAPDLASVRCHAPADEAEARLQVAALARICQALSGVPVMRRGPVTPALLALLRGSPVKACDDGGLAAERALRLVPLALAPVEDADAEARENRLEQAAAELSDDGTDRLEALAYVDALEFLERLGTRGSAPAITRALERRLEDG